MNRRNFIKSAAIAGIGIPFVKNTKLKAEESPYDLVAIKNGEPDVMFDRGIKELGGMKRFVKKGQTVVVKPNIAWDVPPERAGNTHPKLVGRIVEHCYQAGAKKVYVFDYTCDDWKQTYKTSGIERAAKDAGAMVVSADHEKYFQEVWIPLGIKLKTTKEHELILDSDVFINVPILKSHGSARLTMAMKNHMGIIWDRRYWHGNNLHQCIADFASYRKPDLNVMDAYYVMKQNGPRGVSKADVVTMRSQLISTDQVAIDAAGAKLFGIEPDDVKYIKLANQLGVGEIDLNKLNIKRIKLM